MKNCLLCDRHLSGGLCTLGVGEDWTRNAGRRSFLHQSRLKLICCLFQPSHLGFQSGPGNCEGTVFLMRFPVGAASSSTGNITRIAFLAVFYYFCFCSWTELGSTGVHGNEI